MNIHFLGNWYYACSFPNNRKLPINKSKIALHLGVFGGSACGELSSPATADAWPKSSRKIRTKRDSPVTQKLRIWWSLMSDDDMVWIFPDTQVPLLSCESHPFWTQWLERQTFANFALIKKDKTLGLLDNGEKKFNQNHPILFFFTFMQSTQR